MDKKLATALKREIELQMSPGFVVGMLYENDMYAVFFEFSFNNTQQKVRSNWKSESAVKELLNSDRELQWLIQSAIMPVFMVW